MATDEPALKTSGVLNGASLLAGAISPNSMVTVSGNALAPMAGAATASQTQLDGVGVTVNGEAAAVVAVGNAAVTFVAPADLQLGTAAIVVNNNGLASAPVQATVAPDSPGFFTLGSANGVSYVAAEHADGSVIAPAAVVKSGTPAKAGETIALYGTGFGTTAQLTSHPPVVLVAGVPAQVTYAGMIAPGLNQINVTLPPELPAGDAEVIATMGNGASQTQVFVTIGQ